MDILTTEATKLLVPLLATLILGGLKYLAPKVRDNVPNLLWPLALFGLARTGTALCRATDVPCSGNPFEWSETTVTAMATAFVAIVLREATRSVRNGDLKSKIKSLLARLTPSA